MTALMIFLVLAAIVAGLAWLKVGIHATWQDGDWNATFTVGGFPLSWKKTHQSGKKPTPAPKAQGNPSPTKKESRLSLLRQHWREVAVILGKILEKETVELLRFEMIVGDEDPARCAIRYGEVQAAVHLVRPVILQCFRVKREMVQIDCDFARRHSTAQAEIKATIRVYEAVAILFAVLRFQQQHTPTTQNQKKAVQRS